MLTLGTNLAFDLQTLVDTRMLLQANSGGGKSWALRRLLEQTHGKVQHLILDPEGEFATLRERFDYVIAARNGGDTPADPRSAKLLAERLLELGSSAILDIYELKHHERVRFVQVFLEALVNAPKRLWHPALVVVDEAHIFCPEKGDAASADAVIDLATRGRKRGYCAVLATQRISKLRKDAAAELNCKLIGRSALDIDMKRAADELGFTSREQQQTLRELEPGDFFAFGPCFKDRGVVKGKVGAVVTTHPKAGSRMAAPTPPPTKKILALLPKLADLPAEAEARERTLDDLKRENAQLKREMAVAHRAQPPAEPKVVEKIVEVSLLKDEHGRQLNVAVTALRGVADDILAALVAARRAPVRPVVAPKPAPLSRRTPAHEPVDGRLGNSGMRRMLVVLAQNPDGVTDSKLAILAGIVRRGGTFRTYLGKLRTLGYVDGNGRAVRPTEAGLAALGDYTPLPTGEALIDWWRQELGNSGVRQMFDMFVQEYPSALSPDDLGELTGIARTGGTFRTYLGKLKTLELVTGRGDELRAAEELFA